MPSTSTTPTQVHMHTHIPTSIFVPSHPISTAIYTDEVAPRWFINIPSYPILKFAITLTN